MSKVILQGVVISNKSDKTIGVLVSRTVWNRLYKKIIRCKKKYLVHDEGNTHHVGEVVSIKSCSPVSMRKCWIVV